MAVAELSDWNELPLEQRQAAIRRFMQTGDRGLAEQFLSLVRAPAGWGVYASTGPNYQFAIFGRDAIAVAEDLLTIRPELSREIILMLAKLQGIITNDVTEEEPGKIHHEYRRRQFDGQSMPPAAQKVLAQLAPKWGGSQDELCYYGSVDATPKFIRLVLCYLQQVGPDILQQPVIGRDGATRSLQQHLHMAINWLTDKLQASSWQLLEFKRRNRQGLPNQAWRDSEWAYVHLDGAPANADGGIASLEVQGDAYDALLLAAEQLADAPQAGQWRHLAVTLQQQTIQRLWLADQHYFAMGLDRDGAGNTRHIATLTSAPAALLASRLLDSDGQHDYSAYIKAVVEKIIGLDFTTNAGPRLRASQHAGLLDFADYHGAHVTWPFETATIIRGLRRHGYTQQAEVMKKQLLQAIAASGEFYEFFLVSQDGQVKYHYRYENPDEPQFHTFGKANKPEPGQAWTISAVLRLVMAR